MEQLRLFRILILPSPLSLVLTTFISLAYISFIAWSYLSDNPVVYDLLHGPEGLSMYVWQGSEPLIEWFTRVFSSTVGYYILLIGAGLLVGIVTYTVVQIFTHVFHDTTEFVGNAETAPRSRLLEMFAQLWLRCLALVGLVFFAGMTFVTFMPMVNMFIDIGASYLRGFDWRGIIPFIVAFIVCAGTLHMNLVFVRLLLLKPRIFSKSDEL